MYNPKNIMELMCKKELIVFMVFKPDQSFSIQKLANKSKFTRRFICRLIEDLLELQLVTKTPSGRESLIRLTEKGKDIHPYLIEFYRELVRIHETKCV